MINFLPHPTSDMSNRGTGSGLIAVLQIKPRVHSPVLQGLTKLRKARVPQSPSVCPRKLTE